MEVLQKQSKLRNPKHSRTTKQPNTANPPKLHKKIKKNHHKKKGSISAAEPDTEDQLATFITTNPSYFELSLQESVDQLKQKIQSGLNITQILCTQSSLCFKGIRGNFERQLEAYNQLIQSTGKHTSLDRIGLRCLASSQRVQVRLVNECGQTGQLGERLRRVLTESEFVLLRERSQAIPQLERVFSYYTSSKGYNEIEVPQDILQLLVVSKINAARERELISRLDTLTSIQDTLSVRDGPDLIMHQQIFLQNQYIEAMCTKNLQKSFDQSSIDFFNYYKANEYYEENNHQETAFDRITLLSQFKKYSEAKKPKTNKNVIYLLRTACTACLTQFSEMNNPIQNCPECHARIHRHCQNVENRCHRCRYGRTSNLEKSQTSYCYICNRANEKGLLILTVTNRSPHQFAHVYCLLLHHFWSVQNQQLVGEYYRPRLQNHNCIFCNNNEGHYLGCSCCGKQMHGMCAFLHGVSFRMIREGDGYKVQLNCCTDGQLRERLSLQRKFKINHEKIIFRNDTQLYRYMEERYRKEGQAGIL